MSKEIFVLNFNSFEDFYPFYISQHQNKTCRLMHFIGAWLAIIALISSLILQQYYLLIICPLSGYLFAWLGHWLFQKNRPATFEYPLYSFCGDWVMFKDILIGKLELF